MHFNLVVLQKRYRKQFSRQDRFHYHVCTGKLLTHGYMQTLE